MRESEWAIRTSCASRVRDLKWRLTFATTPQDLTAPRKMNWFSFCYYLVVIFTLAENWNACKIRRQFRRRFLRLLKSVTVFRKQICSSDEFCAWRRRNAKWVKKIVSKLGCSLAECGCSAEQVRMMRKQRDFVLFFSANQGLLRKKINDSPAFVLCEKATSTTTTTVVLSCSKTATRATSKTTQKTFSELFQGWQQENGKKAKSFVHSKLSHFGVVRGCSRPWLILQFIDMIRGEWPIIDHAATANLFVYLVNTRFNSFQYVCLVKKISISNSSISQCMSPIAN